MEHRIQDPRYTAVERDTIKDEAESAADKARHAAESAADKAGEMAHQTADKASEIVDTAKQKSAEIGTAAAGKVESAMSATGARMADLAQTVREKAPQEGKPAEIAATAAEALERGGTYLNDADLTMVRSDLERVIREHPLEAMLVGLGIGYLLARATRR